MTTERQRSRRLAWDGCRNSRDLGGYPTRDGGQTRWEAVVRSDELAPLTVAGREALVAHGIRTIIDLRLPAEVTDSPNPFAESGTHGIDYRHLSFLDPLLNPIANPPPEVDTLADEYIRMLDSFQPQVAAIMAAIADAPAGGVLIHCMAGKDRTGLISALLLDLAGVPREIVADDYALTAECSRDWDDDFLANGPGERAERERLLSWAAPMADVMLDVLARLDQRYGGVEAYLIDAGITAAQVARLRQRILSPQSEATG